MNDSIDAFHIVKVVTTNNDTEVTSKLCLDDSDSDDASMDDLDVNVVSEEQHIL